MHIPERIFRPPARSRPRGEPLIFGHGHRLTEFRPRPNRGVLQVGLQNRSYPARDSRGQVQQFTYKEGSSLDASQFYNYGSHPGPGYPGAPGGYRDLQIVRAYYGLNSQNADVTQRLRSMVQANYLDVQVNNNNMGGDPAPGADKVLTVLCRINGREQTATVKEGNRLRIP